MHKMFTYETFKKHQFFFFFLTYKGVGGIVVSIDAYQVIDPGSIPGQRNIFLITQRPLPALNASLT